ncbi:MAG: hypothetical protein LBR81_05365 [Prevotellaceae bacterium]|jgi:tetratricopeptide (TPR) repeat protein|nr:hypothetical protein [Prevotellaceae bacterium]
MKLIPYILFLFFIACNGTNTQNKAQQLNDSAVSMSLLGDTAKVTAAIELLNKATAMQSDYYVAYWNKLIFQRQLGLMDDAFSTLKIMEQLNPENPDLKTMLGSVYEKYKKDTIQAVNKYKEADLLYKSILDTLSSESISYQNMLINYAINTKLLGQENNAKTILTSIIQDSNNEDFNELIDASLVRKTRIELLESVFQCPPLPRVSK